MSTASAVPAGRHGGDRPWHVLQRTGAAALAAGAVARFRAADGMSHARAMAFNMALVSVQAIIGVVGLASLLGGSGFSRTVSRAFESAVPGAAGQVLTAAAGQADRAGQSGHGWGLVAGLVGAVLTGSVTMAQLERSLNRLYGDEVDRPSVAKYARGAVLAASSGVLLAAAAVVLAAGGPRLWRDGGGAGPAGTAARWALAAAVAGILSTGGAAVLYRFCPRRTQPPWSWLVSGAAVGAAGWIAATAGLALFLRFNTTFGEVYGPLAGLVALLVWAQLSAMALVAGGAVAAQLEAVAAGVADPVDPDKVAVSASTSGGEVADAAAGRGEREGAAAATGG